MGLPAVNNNAQLPQSYESAKQALAECERVDECKTWADKAAALASYARQAKDSELMNHAVRIQSRAIQRAGELLEAIEPASGKTKTVGDHSLLSRASVAREAGMSEHQQIQAIRVARIPKSEFESQVESDSPPTITALAEQGKRTVHVTQNSGENEWYTPSKFIEAARSFMGSIDLDPASSHRANQNVRAQKYFSIDDDGLKQQWAGNVWINPPYSKDLVGAFCQKLIASLPDVESACVLLNNATETAWGQAMLQHCDAAVFVAGRIKYLNSNLVPQNTPLQGQVIYCFGIDGKDLSPMSELGEVLFRA